MRLGTVLVSALAVSAGGHAAELRVPDADSVTAGGAVQATARLPDPGYTLLRLGRRYVRWAPTAPDSTTVIRYAFLSAATGRPNTANCRDMKPFPESLKRSTLTPAQFGTEIRRAMAAWEALADIRFEPARDQASADLVIGMQRTARGIAYADVVRSPGPPGATVAIRQAAICFNPELAWENRFDGDDRTPDVRYVAAHELGHVLGLDHNWGSDRVMNFKYRETVRTPQNGDAAGAIYLYGRSRETTARIAFTPSAAVSPDTVKIPGALLR